jgi:hypothetical protein
VVLSTEFLGDGLRAARPVLLGRRRADLPVARQPLANYARAVTPATEVTW